MTSTLQHETTTTAERQLGAEQPDSEAKESTRRGMGIASFADTRYADSREWGPARHRDDYTLPETELGTQNS